MSLPAVMSPGKSRAPISRSRQGHLRRANSVDPHQHHIELPRHDVVLAQGLPAESFLDIKDGSNYAKRPGPVRLYPDLTSWIWEAFGCARLIVTGPELAAARALVGSFAPDQAAGRFGERPDHPHVLDGL